MTDNSCGQLGEPGNGMNGLFKCAWIQKAFQRSEDGQPYGQPPPAKIAKQPRQGDPKPNVWTCSIIGSDSKAGKGGPFPSLSIQLQPTKQPTD